MTKNISLSAAAVLLTLGWATASAEAAPTTVTTGDPTYEPAPPVVPNVYVTAGPPFVPDATPPPPLPPATTTTISVETPPGASVGVNVAPAPVPAPVEARPVQALQSEPVYRPWVSRMNGGLFVGGGFQDFTNSDLRGMTGGGGYWSVRLIGGMRRFVGLEGAYVGDARNINALGLSSNAHLISNGVEGALRVNIPMMSPDRTSLVEPFGFLGLGWSRYSVTNTNGNTSSVASRDDIMTVPYGGGLAFGHNGVMVDARFTYRRTYYNNLVPGENLDNWGIGGQVGFAF